MISIIVAVAKDGVIGGGNRLLWHIPEDLKRFKAVTMGHPVVMGRKTWESIGRPLPGRRNVVITRDRDYKPAGAEIAHSLGEAIGMLPGGEEIFVIGGGEIYRQAMPLAGRLYITYVEAEFDGDTVFPEIDENEWEAVSRERHEEGTEFPHPFEYVDYVRRR